MNRFFVATILLAFFIFVQAASAQTPQDPFPKPIPASEGVVRVQVAEFASIPDIDGQPARMMLLIDEPGTQRLFVNDMRGLLYSVSYDGKSVQQYLDLREQVGDPSKLRHFEQGFQSFAFHPQFTQQGAPGYGKFYTWTDTSNTEPKPDFVPNGGSKTHHTVLLEWTAKNPRAAKYDGDPPRELIRFEQPFPNHNGGMIGFNPRAKSGDADFGLLYMGMADGGSGGDPLNNAQNLNSLYGKILRIDPLGKNSANGKYGIPADNAFAKDNDSKTLGEIYAYGVRNPQRFSWDPKNGNMFLADIGQNIVEEVSLVKPGANLGWNTWEGSYKYVSREGVNLENPRSDPKVTFPFVEYGQIDPILLDNTSSAVTGVYAYRSSAIPQLKDLLVFGDNPSGEIFYVHADKLPNGGQDAIRRILLTYNGETKTLLELIKEKNVQQGKQPAARADLRFGLGPDNQIFLLNKRDGTIRKMAAGR